jgi:IclR family pca regulon transcriptional regulator
MMSASASAPVSARTATVAPGQGDRTPAATSNRTFRSLEYGLGLLRLFTVERSVWGIAELARELNVDNATAHRYAATCLELGYLEQVLTRRYRLTRRCAEPGLAVVGTLELMRAARPILRELRQQTGRTVSLAVLDGDEVLYLQRLRGFAQGQYQLEQGLGVGSRLPARDTAAGRALTGTATEGDDELLSRIDQGGGLTVDEQDPRAGARGLAITVRAPGERPSAIEITVPTRSMTAAELMAELGEPLRATRAAVEAALGPAPAAEEREECVA